MIREEGRNGKGEISWLVFLLFLFPLSIATLSSYWRRNHNAVLRFSLLIHSKLSSNITERSVDNGKQHFQICPAKILKSMQTDQFNLKINHLVR